VTIKATLNLFENLTHIGSRLDRGTAMMVGTSQAARQFGGIRMSNVDDEAVANDAKELIRMCRAGRLYEIERWIADGTFTAIRRVYHWHGWCRITRRASKRKKPAHAADEKHSSCDSRNRRATLCYRNGNRQRNRLVRWSGIFGSKIVRAFRCPVCAGTDDCNLQLTRAKTQASTV